MKNQAKTRVVIIGGGLAGYILAKEVHALDTGVDMTLITGDQGDFYLKPQLSHALSTGKGADDLIVNTAEEMQTSLSCQLMTETEVTEIKEGQVVLSDGNTVPYDALVLAMGAIPGQAVAEPRIFSVNSLSEYRDFRQVLQGARRVGVVGAGLVGIEFTNDLLSQGFQVDMIHPHATPLPGVLPEAIGGALRDAMVSKGLTWHQSTVAEQVADEDSVQVTLADGQTLTVDVLLVATGLKPNVQLALDAGIDCDDGIRVDRCGRSSMPGVYALGDCAQYESSPFKRLHYVGPIRHAAKSLAKTLTQRSESGAFPIVFPVMPVTLKTSIYPVVVCRPARDDGQWQVTYDEEKASYRALYYVGDRLYGFVLTHQLVGERMQWQGQVEPWS